MLDVWYAIAFWFSSHLDDFPFLFFFFFSKLSKVYVYRLGDRFRVSIRVSVRVSLRVSIRVSVRVRVSFRVSVRVKARIRSIFYVYFV